MLEDKIKPSYQNWILTPFLNIHWIHRFNPNVLTLAGLGCGMAIPLLLPFGYPLFALIALALSGFFDTLDGALARSKNISSPKGAVLDITSDRAVEFCIILALYLVDPGQRALLSLLMLGSILLCITSFLVVGIFSRNTTEKSFYYSPGIMERLEAFIFFGLMMLFPAGFPILAILFTSLVFLTAFIRLKQFVTNFS